MRPRRGRDATLDRGPRDRPIGGPVPRPRRRPGAKGRRFPRPPQDRPAPGRRGAPRDAEGAAVLLREPLHDPRRTAIPGRRPDVPEARGDPRGGVHDAEGPEGPELHRPRTALADPRDRPGRGRVRDPRRGPERPHPGLGRGGDGRAPRAGPARGRPRKTIDARLARDGPEAAIKHFQEAWPLNKTGAKRIVEEHANHRKAGAPMPTDDRIVLQAFDRFLIVHASFGEIVNETLGDLIEEFLARKHLVRFWWTDASRILYDLVADTRELDVQGLADELFRLDDATLEDGLKALLEDHLPLGDYMKGIAERFGALRRGLAMGEGEMNSLEVRFANTPIEDEAVREALLLHADFDRVRHLVRRIRTGEIEIAVHRSEETPTPLAYPILRRYVEAPELFSPEAEREEILERMRLSLASEPVHLLCFECGHFHEEVRVGEMPERPECEKCGSRLLTALGWSAWTVRDALAKRMRKVDVSDEERKLLTRAKQG